MTPCPMLYALCLMPLRLAKPSKLDLALRAVGLRAVGLRAGGPEDQVLYD
jgi:hypothetical protein